MIDLPIDRAVFDALVQMTGGDMDFVDELVHTFLEDGIEQVGALRAAVAASDMAALGRPAHSLKSSSFNLGAMELGELCKELEQLARLNVVVDAPARVDSIAAGFDRAREALLAERAMRRAG